MKYPDGGTRHVVTHETLPGFKTMKILLVWPLQSGFAVGMDVPGFLMSFCPQV